MNCRELRDRLASPEAIVPAAVLRDHLHGCPACAAFAKRIEAARELLASASGDARPDPGFAARVVSRLPAGPELLGWAAVRLLPATLALVLALAGWTLLRAPSPSELVSESPTDDLLTWVLQTPEPAE